MSVLTFSSKLARMISVSKALEIVKQNTPVLGKEAVLLEDVGGRILAEEIRADMDLPPFDRAQMDGYAVKAEDTKNVPARLKIVGEAAAGKGWHHQLNHGEAVRIMTGAAVPRGANAVQKVESTRDDGVFVEILEPVHLWQNIVGQASEILKGSVVFEPGERITTAMIASLASFGYTHVRVGKSPRVSILATGSEIVPIHETPGVDQIRNSNSATLRAYAEQCGATTKTLPIADDELENLKFKILNVLHNCDCLILSGGVSIGKYDFTKTALRELGAEIIFERVALRPGKPTVFGKLGETLIFGLPGNPVSAIVTFNLFVRAALLKMQGAKNCELKSAFAVSGGKFKGAPERDSLLPAELSIDENARLVAGNLQWTGSSDFVGFARADALVFVPRGETIEPQTIVKVLLLP